MTKFTYYYLLHTTGREDKSRSDKKFLDHLMSNSNTEFIVPEEIEKIGDPGGHSNSLHTCWCCD